jgi:hypothetical protein
MPAKKTPILNLPAPRLRFDTLQMRTTPFLYGGVTDILDPVLYQALAQSFPPATLFHALDGGGQQEAHAWRASARAAVRTRTSPSIRSGRHFTRTSNRRRFSTMRAALQPHGVDLPATDTLSASFEFSRLPSDGGQLLPHTDLPEKLVTDRDRDAARRRWRGTTRSAAAR